MLIGACKDGFEYQKLSIFTSFAKRTIAVKFYQNYHLILFQITVLMCESKLWSHAGAMVKNPPANAGDARDMSSIPGLRSPGVGIGNHSSIPA